MRFLAIDFETANDDRSSARAIGLVLTDGTHVLGQHYARFKPETHDARPTSVHGIAFDECPETDFSGLWPEIEPLLARADVLIAHDAPHVRDLFAHLMGKAKIKQSEKPFVCTRKLARHTWHLTGSKLQNVADHFSISVDTENALSRALACARILARALSAEVRLEDGIVNAMRLPTMSTKIEPLVPHRTVATRHDHRVGAPAMAWVIAVVGSLLLLAVP